MVIEFVLDLEIERRFFQQQEKQAIPVSLERFWWQELERVTAGPDERKSWVLGWIEDADIQGVDRVTLVRARIHQLVVEYGPSAETEPDPILVRVERISQLRKKKMTWRDVADALNYEGLLPIFGNDKWSSETVRAFFKHNTPRR